MGSFLARALNPFLAPFYTRQTLLVLGLGIMASMMQARIITAFMPLAILTMDFSGFNERTRWTYYLWSALCVAFWYYTLWRLGAWV